MPESVKLKKQVTIEQFARKKILISIWPNMIINALICYYNFTRFNPLYLIEGYYSVSKMMLAIAAFVPFSITFDIIWNARKMSQKGEIDFVLDEYFDKNKSVFKICGINSFYTWLGIFYLVMIAYLTLPNHYQFNSLKTAIACGIIAGIYTIIFTLISIRQLKKHIIAPIKLPVPA